ncbi:hypothetical protein [Saccharothrix longispora]|nr:hypothetical protein [Saccharothrix longispora]MDU0288982.1 hypothetical protein [Saccharothrix longispora]
MPNYIVIGSGGPIVIIIELGGVELSSLRPTDLEKLDVAATAT